MFYVVKMLNFFKPQVIESFEDYETAKTFCECLKSKGKYKVLMDAEPINGRRVTKEVVDDCGDSNNDDTACID